MTISQAATTLGVSRPTVYKMIEDGRLRALRRDFMTTKKFLVESDSVLALREHQAPYEPAPPREP